MQHVVSSLPSAGTLDRDQIGNMLDHTDRTSVAVTVFTNSAMLTLSHVTADVTAADGLTRELHNIQQLGHRVGFFD